VERGGQVALSEHGGERQCQQQRSQQGDNPSLFHHFSFDNAQN
jgi:hypothetical protein